MNITATERLWMTADRSRLVPDKHPEAAFLFCAPGQSIPEAEARKYGLISTPEHVVVSLPKAKPEIKPQPKVETKPVESAEAKVEYPQESRRTNRKGKGLDLPPTGDTPSSTEDSGTRE